MMQQPPNGIVNDHASSARNVFDHVTEFALPNLHSNTVNIGLVNRSVMHDVEPFSKSGLRSRVMKDTAIDIECAGTVPVGPDAKHLEQTGAVPAHAGGGLQVQIAIHKPPQAKKFVIEKYNADVLPNAWEEWRKAMEGKSIRTRGNHQFDLHARTLPARDMCFAIVKAAREQIVGEADQRRKRKDTQTGLKTIADYKKKCAQIDREIDDLEPGGPNPLTQVMGRHAASKQSFSAIKTALKWRALEEVRVLLKRQDAFQRVGGDDNEWRHAVDQLHLASNALTQIQMLKRDEVLELSDSKRRASRSKKLILPRLTIGWQDRFLSINEASKTYRLAGVLLRHCGLRPVELAMGAKLEINSVGVSVSIEGGKVRETAGQPLRSFTLDLKMLPVWFVNEVRAAGRVNVLVHEDALRAHLSRLSNDVFYPRTGKKIVPNKPNRLKLSAYVFRHALVTELRDAGWEEHEIAAVLGERAAETARYYGNRTGGGRLSPPVISIVKSSVQTSRVVRLVDNSGLKALKKSRPVAATRGA
jgi:hypothetical protein